jgi:hypothetical protein
VGGGVSIEQREVIVDVKLRRRRLACPYCDYLSWFRYETRPRESTWTHLDLGRWECTIRAPKTDPAKAKTFKGARWALLKNPTDLNDEQQATLRRLRRRGGDLWRGYRLN